MIKGNIFDITRGSFNDGPGIRTVCFFQGCPLNCIWCHNPESKNITSASCRSYSLNELIDEIEKDREYYEATNGGVTISGGEPMLQFRFLKELLKKLREKGINIALETSGYAPMENFIEIEGFVDLFLIDYKYEDKLIENNFLKLYEMGADIIRRCPIIPEVNFNKTHMKNIAYLSLKYPKVKYFELLPYHNLWQGKVGVNNNLAIPSLDNRKGIERIKKMISPYKRDHIKLNSEFI